MSNLQDVLGKEVVAHLSPEEVRELLARAQETTDELRLLSLTRHLLKHKYGG